MPQAQETRPERNQRVSQQQKRELSGSASGLQRKNNVIAILQVWVPARDPRTWKVQASALADIRKDCVVAPSVFLAGVVPVGAAASLEDPDYRFTNLKHSMPGTDIQDSG
ncbi:hypothetical protein NDU88_005424 [Pleurodeles waltl]|uniref:Uncharacterized protein n=1 Tax=Pleurodeles waltl TaxID=8319 RepID=A0AAV7WUN8_PLEWA|nr:hypothetical protein NDU88_005424 [Pleurodeles waltl]